MTLALNSPRTLLHRWPTLLAIAFAALTLSDGRAEPGVGVALLVAAAGYVAIAAIDRPVWTWPTVVVLFTGVVTLRAFDVDEVPVLAGALIVAVIGGLLAGRLRRTSWHLLQVPVGLVGVAVFAAATHVPTTVGAVLVAAGLLAHAAWDTVLWRRDAVIARSFAEWCAVFDVLVGFGLIVLVIAS